MRSPKNRLPQCLRLKNELIPSPNSAAAAYSPSSCRQLIKRTLALQGLLQQNLILLLVYRTGPEALQVGVHHLCVKEEKAPAPQPLNQLNHRHLRDFGNSVEHGFANEGSANHNS